MAGDAQSCARVLIAAELANVGVDIACPLGSGEAQGILVVRELNDHAHSLWATTVV
jgi:hypothetical protein